MSVSNKQTEEKVDYFHRVREIGEIMKQAGGMNELFCDFAEPHLAFLSDKLQVSRTASALFASLINMYNGHNIDMNNLAAYINLKSLEVISFLDELEELEEKELIEIDHGYNKFNPLMEVISFKIPFKTINCLRKGSFQDLNKAKGLSNDEFFEYLEEMFDDMLHKAIPYGKTISRMNNILQDNKQLLFVRKVLSLSLDYGETLILLRFFSNLVSLDTPEMELRILSTIYERRSEYMTIKRLFLSGNHVLITRNLIENACGDGFRESEVFCITNEVKEEFLAEFDLTLSSAPLKGVKSYESIAEKQLFYPGKTQDSIGELTEVLMTEKFLEIKNRLSEKKMRTGFACLFSGAPGTGKTETAYQIARQTGRGIMQIDIASVKSKWFGESEKQIKGIFDKYRYCVKKSDITPILLFNEADAIFSKRRRIQENYSGPAQTENAIQNIILQEMETLDGILIATTNLSSNMDGAFERRFLYKIEFEKPEVETRRAIWLSMMDGISDSNAHALAENYDFSGGQIENIARKAAVHFVLSGEIPSLQNLMRFCDAENQESESCKIIGFVA
ncbi:MAG: ATP-binding protein [Treponema sp.]|nr:ATP-binding protein [Treponema sp.]